jgi:hypothetical protein
MSLLSGVDGKSIWLHALAVLPPLPQKNTSTAFEPVTKLTVVYRQVLNKQKLQRNVVTKSNQFCVNT